MKKINENGRSMVEMLGVLAIIGVLSIGGIAGYTMAMNRYRANEILDAASKLSIVAQSANAGQGSADVTLTQLGYGSDTLHGATFTVSANGQVSVSGMTTGVANAIGSVMGTACTDDCVVAKGSSATE
ncbi:MAG: hypothetical protein ACI4QM_02235 [Alphaproteobacteria bacterium]